MTFHIVRDIIIKSQACACRIWRYSSVGESNRFIPGGSLVQILLPLLHGPLVKRLRLQPLTLASPVRFWYGSPLDCTSLVQSFVWTISSVGQSVRLITGRSRVRVPDGPPKRSLTYVKDLFVLYFVSLTTSRCHEPSLWLLS